MEEPKHALSSVESINTRREVLSQGVLLSAGAVTAASFAGAFTSEAKAETAPGAEQALYYRLGGIFAIAAVVNYFTRSIGERAATNGARR